jgi:hypothetical protein
VKVLLVVNVESLRVIWIGVIERYNIIDRQLMLLLGFYLELNRQLEQISEKTGRVGGMH